MTDQLPPLFVLLRKREYYTLLAKGLLHAVPASRFLTAAQAEDYAAWHHALPPGETHRTQPWLLLGVAGQASPLDLSQAHLGHLYPLDEQQAQELLTGMVGNAPAAATWFGRVLEALKLLLRVRNDYPHGVLVVPRVGDERPELAERLTFTNEQFIAPDQIRQFEAWNRAIPDIEDDNYALILPLRQPLGSSPARVRDQFRDTVIPLTQRGALLLREQSGYGDFSTSPPQMPGEVLLARRSAEAVANAVRLSNMVPLKLADRNKLAAVLPELEQAATARRRREQATQTAASSAGPTTFWDALLDYDRTGEAAEFIPDNSRGFLLDLVSIAKSFLKAQKERSQLGEAAQLIGPALNEWGKLAQDSTYDSNAFSIFSPKSSGTKAGKILNAHLSETKLDALAAGYYFLSLLRTHGHHEQDFTPAVLAEILAFVQANKLEAEFALGLYGVGLLMPASRFLEVYRALPPALASPVKDKAAPTKVSPSRKIKASAPVEPEATPTVQANLFAPPSSAPDQDQELPYAPTDARMDNADTQRVVNLSV